MVKIKKIIKEQNIREQIKVNTGKIIHTTKKTTSAITFPVTSSIKIAISFILKIIITIFQINEEQVCIKLGEQIQKLRVQIQDLKNNILKLNDRTLKAEEERNNYKQLYETSPATWKTEFDRLNAEWEKRYNLLEEQIKGIDLNSIPIIINEKAPEWLDNSKPAYYPIIKSSSGASISIHPNEIYVYGKTLLNYTKQEQMNDLTYIQRLFKIWDVVCRRLTYRTDTAGEDWQFPSATWFLKEGDCEDGTNLFVTLCMISGIPSNRVFNVCGRIGDRETGYGHSFPIVWLPKGEWGEEGWYIMETTLSSATGIMPMKFYGSHYYGDWGVANWHHQGKINDDSGQV